jgi:GxxExxY protein
MENHKHSDITSMALKCYYNVYNALGFGFLEKVYESAMLIELSKKGLTCLRQHPVEVFYESRKIGLYFADIIINECVIIEIKAAEALCEAHEAQLINYLKATTIEVGLLLNFGKKPKFKRKVFTNDRKILTGTSAIGQHIEPPHVAG